MRAIRVIRAIRGCVTSSVETDPSSSNANAKPETRRHDGRKFAPHGIRMSFRAPQFAVKSEMEQDCWEQKRHLYAKWIALQIHTSRRRCQWAEKMRKMRTRAKSPRLQLGRIRCHESDRGS